MSEQDDEDFNADAPNDDDDGTLDDNLAWLFDPDVLEAAHEAWHGQVGPVVTLSTVHAGAMRGFKPGLARTVLNDVHWLSYVNGVWEGYQDAMYTRNQTGLETLPLAFQDALRREKFEGGEQLNLQIAHAAGRGWTDADLDFELFSLELEARPFNQEVLVAPGMRGKKTDQSPETEREPWEAQFHAESLVVLVRKRDANSDAIIVQLESQTEVRTYRLTLHWADGSVTQLDDCRTGLGMAPARFGNVTSPDGKLPTNVSVKIV
ncbi:hypothetical protein OZX67_02155 [Bifidobacterium sp. ESL0728]|uniref:hypothetical protein n=1 Tax=Bifidobacterium sp. ESL0728 TaxID=2983220 RepID=UPI0023F83109|nr:hypothetical protein [Bifidobacterium sp. ESL0728]WEV59388.1 hypothetical protein OZX67_02155 [Bifidobacterium sp. ESL0728]